MFNKKSISLVIPCFNEEDGLTEILKKIPSIVDEVIVIDNNSTDKTSKVANEFGAQIIYVDNPGYGAAYQKGLPAAKGDIIITMDGDDSYPVDSIEKIIILMEQSNSDFVSGCRFPLKNANAMPFINKLANFIISYLIRVYFKVKIKDSQSGMWIFKRDILGEIISHNQGMGFSQEIKLNAWLNSALRCSELDIDYHKRKGKVKFKRYKDSLKNLYDALVFLKRVKKDKII